MPGTASPVLLARSAAAALSSALPRVIGVVGAGQMGSGIAQVAAMSGHEVLLVDPNQAALKKSEDGIGASLSRLCRKGALTEVDTLATQRRITRLTELTALQPAEFVIEAATEQEDLKTIIFQNLDQVVQPSCVLATNTSSISITRLAARTGRPEKVVSSPRARRELSLQ